MKKCILFVCLFSLLTCTQVFAKEDYQQRVYNLISKENIEDDQVLSKELNELNQELNEQIDGLETKLGKCQSKEEGYISKIDDLEQKIAMLSESIPLYMQLYQYGKEDNILDMYSSYYEKKEKILLQQQSLQNKIDTLSSTIDEYNSYIDLILDCQIRLFNKNNLKEIKKDGQYNTETIIKGVDDLPAYGGYYDASMESNQACLQAGAYSIDSYSDAWIFPIQNGSISAGTWAYPGGGLHLGLDFACSLYSQVKAPANGIVLYADAPVDTDCGYLGNWVGWPLGGGNTVAMICAVNGQLYGVTFCHLSQEIEVVAGQQVSQGTVIALSGNSGNSSGPHCHIEVFSLNCTLEEAVSYFISSADFAFGNGFDQAETCSAYACRIRPESVWG